jgi:hypothetical protein
MKLILFITYILIKPWATLISAVRVCEVNVAESESRRPEENIKFRVSEMPFPGL